MKESFFEDVYAIVRLIPRGRVTSYGAIAAYLGAKGSARVVGWAMNGATGLQNVPAHRVVNRLGLLTGRANFIPPEKMEQLLQGEGVTVRDNKVENFQRIFWDPAVELAL